MVLLCLLHQTIQQDLDSAVLLALSMLLALLASLADEVALHGAESLAGPADDHELADLHHQSAHHYASRPPPTRTGNEAEEAVAVVVQQLVQEVEEAANEAHVAGGVTRGELLQVRR